MSLANKVAKGMVWTTTSTILRSIASLVQIAVLTRHLAIEDFGAIAIASVFIGFTQLFLDLGISVGIMHKQDTTREEYSSLFWLNIIAGFILTIFLVVCSPLIAKAYNDDSLTPVIMLLSLSVLIAAIGSQHRTIQQKMMRFKLIAIVEIISSLVTVLVAIILAIGGYGIYSLVFSTLSGVIVSNVVFLIIGLFKDNNVYFHFKLSETYRFLKIGVFSIGSQILDYFSREIDIIFIGASFGKEVLGVYSLCKKIVQMLYGIINPIITKVLTPLFAVLQADKSKIKKVYLTLVESLSIVNLPVYILVSIFARSILLTLYGESFVSGTFILSVLAIYYGILSLSNPVGSLQIAFGRTDIGFYWTIYRVLVTLLIVYIASFFNIEMLVILFLLMSIINTLLLWYFQIRVMIKIKFKEYINSFLKPLLVVILLSIPFYYLFWSKSSIYVVILASSIYIAFYITIATKFFENTFIMKQVFGTLDKVKNKYFGK